MAELNTQFPAWLAQQSWLLREDRKRVGTEFLQGAQLGANIRHQRAQEDIAAQEMNYRNRALELQRDAFELKRQGELQMSEGTVALGKTLSEIAATGSWDSPQAEVKFWDTVRRYPGLSQSPNFDNLIGIFERAKQAKLQRDLAIQRAEAGFAPGRLEKDYTFLKGLGWTDEQLNAFVAADTGTSQTGGPIKANTIVGENGAIIGHYVGGKGGLHVKWEKPEKEISPAMRLSANRILLQSYDNQLESMPLKSPERKALMEQRNAILERVKEIEKEGGVEIPKPVPPVSERVKGQTYQTPKGPAEWTGEGWILK